MSARSSVAVLQAPAWQPVTSPRRARHTAAVTAKAGHMATISTKRRDRPQPRSSNQALLPAAQPAAAQGAELPACDEAREQELAAEVVELKKKYAASVQVRASQNMQSAAAGAAHCSPQS